MREDFREPFSPGRVGARMSRKLLALLLLLCRAAGSRWGTERTAERRKKEGLVHVPLVYPLGGTFKMLFGCAVPIVLPGRTLVHTQNFQIQFQLPQNASVFRDFLAAPGLLRRRRSDVPSERSVFYRLLEQELNRRGAPGRDCIRRSLCEAAETPLGEEGLVGEILHVLLTPDYGDSPEEVDEDYRRAAVAGRQGAQDCSRLYPSCPKGFGILDYISAILDLD